MPARAGKSEHALARPAPTERPSGADPAGFLVTALVDGSLYGPCQPPPLRKYGPAELVSQSSRVLRSSIASTSIPCLSETVEDFTDEEDVYLMAFRGLSKVCLADFLVEFGHHFRFRRTLEQIQARLDVLTGFSELELERIVEAHGRRLTLIERGFPVPLPVSFPDVEIAALEASMKYLAVGAFGSDTLALFAGDEAVFTMRHQCVTIGAGGVGRRVMVDLRGFDERVPVSTLTRFAAVVMFMEDGCFYIENTGRKTFAVNGTDIPPGSVAKVPDQSIFDFADVIFMFLIATETVQAITNEFNSKIAGI